ncbi:MAG: fatty acid desaturase [Pseudomonadota bacterium]|nr:fatty acid desaturase [Pseudomonadota bacterium]
MIAPDVLTFVSNGILDWPVWKMVVATLALTHVTIAGVTIYLHRCQAHRALDLHPAVSHFFRMWLWLTTGMQTGEWAAIHRKHHAKCETVDDPHSPQVKGIRKVLFEGSELYMHEADNDETIDKYGRGTPEDWIERNVYSKFVWHGVGLMLVIDWVLFGVGFGTTVWAIQMLWIPFWAAGVINGVGHFTGYRNYDSPDASRNIVPWGFVIGGEELQNNHHTFATSAKLSSRWYEFDIGWMYIRILSALKLATVKKVAPKPRFENPRAVVDLENLQAVIVNRYDVMAKFAKSFKRAHREEVARLRSADESTAIDVARVQTAGRWLDHDVSKLSPAVRVEVEGALAESPVLAKIHEMRSELAAIWERSSASSEQLLLQLQDWCKRAEDSGVRALQDFSLRLRSYAA